MVKKEKKDVKEEHGIIMKSALFVGKLVDDAFKAGKQYIDDAPERERKKIEKLNRQIKVEEKQLALEKVRAKRLKTKQATTSSSPIINNFANPEPLKYPKIEIGLDDEKRY